MRTGLLLSLTTTLAVLSAATLPTVKTIEPVEISRLNDCVQLRFLDRKAFGINRIGPGRYHQGLRTFQPENPTEAAVIEQLKEKHLEVAIFLVGRQALIASPWIIGRAGLQGPASVKLLQDAELPDAAFLLSEGRIALAKTGEGSDVRTGNWTVALRPLRAGNQTCVQCHAAQYSSGESSPKLGDALGVAMYAYRHHE
jgi:hypothetical protein